MHVGYIGWMGELIESRRILLNVHSKLRSSVRLLRGLQNDVNGIFVHHQEHQRNMSIRVLLPRTIRN